MAYQVVNVDVDRLAPNTALGIDFTFNNLGVFKSIYDTNKQALANLKTLLLTRKGERYGLPEFGTDLLYIIFQPNVDDIKDNIKDIILGPIGTWLPYIEIDEIDVKTLKDDPRLIHTIEVTISFTVLKTADSGKIRLFAKENGILEVK